MKSSTPDPEATATQIIRAWGKAIEVQRCRKDMSQTGLAAAIGSSQPAMSRIERGVQEPPLELRLAIAEALGTTHDDLFGLPATEDVA